MRVGLVGFGSIAEHGHLPALESFPGVDVTAIADLSPDRLERARAAAPAATLFESPHTLIARAEVDTLDICTPPSSHADLILAACERGIPSIVCEKPLVLTEDEYREVACARARSGSRLVSVNNWVSSDLNRHVTRVIREGLIGEVRKAVLRTGRPDCARGSDGWMPRWRTDATLSGGGIILDHGWHQLYLMLGWVRQPVVSVSATARTVDARHAPVEDQASIELGFPEAEGRIELSWTTPERSNDGFIEGTDGKIFIHDDRIVVHNGANALELPFSGRLTQSSYHPDWFHSMFQRGILDENSLEADRSFAEAGVLVGVIGAAYRSARENGKAYRPVFLGGETPAVAEEGMERKDVYSGSGYPA